MVNFPASFAAWANVGDTARHKVRRHVASPWVAMCSGFRFGNVSPGRSTRTAAASSGIPIPRSAFTAPRLWNLYGTCRIATPVFHELLLNCQPRGPHENQTPVVRVAGLQLTLLNIVKQKPAFTFVRLRAVVLQKTAPKI